MRANREQGIPRMPLYEEDLAYIQAVAFGGLASGAMAAVIERLRASPIPVRRVIDVGCGAGISTRALVDAGFDTWAIEPSASLVAIARNTAPGARFELGSVYDVALDSCEAILALGEPLTYHDPDIDADARLRTYFERAAGALAPGGLMIFDLIEAEGAPLDARGWSSGDDWAVLYETREDRVARRLTRYIENFRRPADAIGYRRSREVHDVRTFETRDVKRWLDDAGFSVEIADRYGAYALAPRRRAFFATRHGR
jgi:SAM-dependent methyltransferase